MRRTVLALLATLLLAAPAWATQVTFRYQPVIGGVSAIHLAGSMNTWDKTAAPLKDADGDGVWEVTLDLAPGRYEYKFVVGDEWFTDDFAMDSAPDGFGGQNSLIVVKDEPLITGPGGNVKAKAAAAEGKLRNVTFRHRPTGKPREIVLAGTFNEWKVGATPLRDPDGDGEYDVTLLLPEGDVQYKFVIDGAWTTDRAHADAYLPDGFGGENSVLHVDSRFPAVEVQRGDGIVTEAGIDHTQTATEVNNLGGGRVEITVRAHRGDVEDVSLLVADTRGERTLPMRVAATDGAFDQWRCDLTLDDGGAACQYLPVYRDGSTVRYLTAGGMRAEKPPLFGWYAFDATLFPAFETPDWVKDAVIYQIFPDRFRNGNKANDQNFSEWYYAGKNKLPASGLTNEEYYHVTPDWYDVAGLTRSPYRTDGKPDYFSFYGGDVAGVRQGLDYLEDLGVTAIYFNPIFEAKSNHKYDCADYKKIDPHFGTNEEFAALVQEAHGRGIRIILDIVFNHCGNAHWAFAEAMKQGSSSPYYPWYEIKKWPCPPSFSGGDKPENYYACWWGFGDLPDFNFDLSRPNTQENAIKDRGEAQPNTPLLAHLMEVTDYWVGTMQCDGVRLDVPNEVPFWFWKDFNHEVKEQRPDAYIVGELWGNAADYVGPKLFDATMNYAFFRDPVVKFLGQGRGTAREFDHTLATGRGAYPTQAVQVMMNLVGSHDTVRFRNQVGGDLARVKLAALFAMTYLGAPHIYYGDEIGMEGEKDPDCRRPFLWNWESDPARADLHATYRALARARAGSAALRRGTFTTLYAEGQVMAYLREQGEDRILVVLNAGKSAGKADLDLARLGPAHRGVDLVTGEARTLEPSMAVNGESGFVLRLE